MLLFTILHNILRKIRNRTSSVEYRKSNFLPALSAILKLITLKNHKHRAFSHVLHNHCVTTSYTLCSGSVRHYWHLWELSSKNSLLRVVMLDSLNDTSDESRRTRSDSEPLVSFSECSIHPAWPSVTSLLRADPTFVEGSVSLMEFRNSM
jgi:hypothetical protein